jgi:hypothetical protein
MQSADLEVNNWIRSHWEAGEYRKVIECDRGCVMMKNSELRQSK